MVVLVEARESGCCTVVDRNPVVVVVVVVEAVALVELD